MKRLRRPSRYIQVGALCALVNNAIVISLDRLHVHYAIGVTVGFMIVMFVSYSLHTRYTFEKSPSFAGWLRFVSVNLSGFPLSMGSMFVLCDLAGLSASIAMPIATVLLLVWNYLLAYLTIARPQDARAEAKA